MIRIKLNSEEKYTLQQIYLAYQTPTDQLRRNPETLKAIVEAFCFATGTQHDPEAIVRYMITRRKSKDWPKLGESALKKTWTKLSLSDDELLTLRQLYGELRQSVDNYLFSKDVAETLQSRFTEATGRVIGGWQLVALMMTKRKNGEWVKSNGPNPPTAKPFSDINEVIRKQANG